MSTRLPLAAFCAAALGVSAATGGGTPRSASRTSVELGRTVRQTALAGVAVVALRPELRDDPRLGSHFVTILNTVRLFDLADDPASLDAMVSLASYNLGEAGNEAWRCVVVRKGVAVRGRLEALRGSFRNECLDEFAERGPTKSRIACLDPAALPFRLESLIKEIDKGAKCNEL